MCEYFPGCIYVQSVCAGAWRGKKKVPDSGFQGSLNYSGSVTEYKGSERAVSVVNILLSL